MAAKKKTQKKRAAKKAASKPAGKLVNEEREGGCLMQVYEDPEGVTVLRRYEGAVVAPEDAPKVGREVVIRKTNRECPSCGGKNTKQLKSLSSTCSFRCFSCVDPKTGQLRTFYLPREPRRL